MKTDRRWYNDGRLDLEAALARAERDAGLEPGWERLGEGFAFTPGPYEYYDYGMVTVRSEDGTLSLRRLVSWYPSKTLRITLPET